MIRPNWFPCDCPYCLTTTTRFLYKGDLHRIECSNLFCQRSFLWQTPMIVPYPSPYGASPFERYLWDYGFR